MEKNNISIFEEHMNVLCEQFQELTETKKDGFLFTKYIDKSSLIKAKQVLTDNEIDKGEADVVLQALCFVLFDIDIEDYLYPEILDE